MPRNKLIQFRRGLASLWTSRNPILDEGEAGYETDTKKIKVGDGTTAWTSLDYITEWGAGGGGGGGAVDSVNGEIGDVVLDSDDINEGSANLYLTVLERAAIIANAATLASLDSIAFSGDYDDLNNIPAVSLTYLDLVTGYKIEPVLNSTIASGDVYNYSYDGASGDVTYYRLVPSGGSDDAFYTTFDAGILSGQIVKKGIII